MIPVTDTKEKLMSMKTWLSGSIAVAGTVAALMSGPAHAQSFTVQVAPPPPQVEVVPAPRQGNVWVAGHWKWSPRDARYVWKPGHWQVRRAGYLWAPAAWVQVGGAWRYREGTWIRPSACRDADRDGICNRHDRDRDGDGVGNRNDARPGNPNAR
jgi:hypothetical protein